jgi:hypothetical protein
MCACEELTYDLARRMREPRDGRGPGSPASRRQVRAVLSCKTWLAVVASCSISAHL